MYKLGFAFIGLGVILFFLTILTAFTASWYTIIIYVLSYLFGGIGFILLLIKVIQERFKDKKEEEKDEYG